MSAKTAPAQAVTANKVQTQPDKGGLSWGLIFLVLVLLFIGSAAAAYYFYPPAKGLIRGQVLKYAQAIPIIGKLLPLQAPQPDPVGTPAAPAPDQEAVLEAQRKLLAETKARLDEQELKLKSERESLDKIKKELDVRAGQLDSDQAKLDGKLASYSHLAKIYSQMKPAEAAVILAKMNEKTVAIIFGRMEEAQVAKILANLDPIKAASLSDLLKPPIN